MPKLHVVSSLLCLTAAFALPIGCASGTSEATLGQTAQALSTGQIVINQVFTGGSSNGAYNQDFVELFNPSAASVSLDGASLQVGSVSGDFGADAAQIVLLNGTVKAGGYYLIGLAKASGGTDLPQTPKVTSSSDLDYSGGKVALVGSTDALGCGGVVQCAPSKYIDLVGWGASSQAEGGAKVQGLDGAKAAVRKNGGCTDTNNNFNDFLPQTVTADSFHAADEADKCAVDAGVDAGDIIPVTDPDLPDDNGEGTDAGKDAGKSVSSAAAGDDSSCSVKAVGAGDVSAMTVLAAGGFVIAARRRRRRR